MNPISAAVARPAYVESRNAPHGFLEARMAQRAFPGAGRGPR
ncbi:Uncharacterized protein pbN1_12510 [Aromatoleum bremense]|nr:Uncharacterized protein pbN1_12510 [Aromatoleum bremense]